MKKSNTPINGYASRIEEQAKELGYKSANLIFLRDFLEEDSDLSSDIKTEVPNFVAIEHSIILGHLQKYAPEFQKLWEEFVKGNPIQIDANGTKYLSENAKKQLIKIQEIVLKCFRKNPLNNEDLSGFTKDLKDTDLVMVRSTGKEDSTELSNPGGNESKPSKAGNISETLGSVIASYFGEKSFMQRLNGGDDITQFPLLPALVQVMIMERQDALVVSGVMYNDYGGTRIQAAPGHGELIVNSRGNFDNYYVTSQEMLYSEVRAKDKRLITKDKNGEAKELVFQNNSNKAKYESALDEDVLLHLHRLALKIERKYGRRMDMEFIYDPQKRTVFLVQARAVTAKAANPSSLNPDLAAQFNEHHKLANGQVITPDVNRAILITKPDEVIICQTIGEALDRFKKGQTRAVIIQKEAPDTSHEAGEFNNQGVPVLQIENIESIKEKIEKGEPLLLDPQRKSLFGLPPEFESKSENDLFSQGVLKEGVFKSTLTAHSKPSKTPLAGDVHKADPEEVSNIGVETLGSLIHQAKKGDPNATKKLLDFTYHIIQNQTPSNLEGITNNLRALEFPTYDGNNDSQKAALAQLLRMIFKMSQATDQHPALITPQLFREIMLSGAELFVLLDQMGQGAYNKDNPLTYLNSLEKFTGLIASLPKKDVLSESVAQSLMENRHQEEVDAFLKGSSFSQEQQDYFIELSKLARFLINQDKKEQWYRFCRDVCKKTPMHLGRLVENVVKYGVYEQWINIVFLQSYEARNSNSEETFRHLLETMPNLDKYERINDKLSELESSLPLWSDPAKFPKLFQALQNSINQIDQDLTFSSNLSTMEKIIALKKVHNLVDVMDKIIKAVSKSAAYNDVNQQGINTKELLVIFYNLMEKWAKSAGFEEENMKVVFKEMRGLLDKLQPPFTKESLSASPNFAVNAATIDKVNSNHQSFSHWQFSRVFNDKCKTLEDVFTLIHQNSLISIGTLSKEHGSLLKQECPPLISNFAEELEKEFTITHYKLLIKPEFLYSNLENQVLTLHYNIPLLAHSAAVVVKYDLKQKNKDKAITVNYSSTGIEQFNRWKIAELYMNFAMRFKIEFVQDPYFAENKETFSAEVELANEGQIELLISSIHELLNASFMVETSQALAFLTSQIQGDSLFVTNAFMRIIKNLNLKEEERLDLIKLLAPKIQDSVLSVDNFIKLIGNFYSVEQLATAIKLLKPKIEYGNLSLANALIKIISSQPLSESRLKIIDEFTKDLNEEEKSKLINSLKTQQHRDKEKKLELINSLKIKASNCSNCKDFSSILTQLMYGINHSFDDKLEVINSLKINLNFTDILDVFKGTFFSQASKLELLQLLTPKISLESQDHFQIPDILKLFQGSFLDKDRTIEALRSLLPAIPVGKLSFDNFQKIVEVVADDHTSEAIKLLAPKLEEKPLSFEQITKSGFIGKPNVDDYCVVPLLSKVDAGSVDELLNNMRSFDRGRKFNLLLKWVEISPQCDEKMVKKITKMISSFQNYKKDKSDDITRLNDAWKKNAKFSSVKSSPFSSVIKSKFSSLLSGKTSDKSWHC